jgi:plastocyanin
MVFLPNVLWVNVGDKVVWTSKVGEIHTVTFLAPGQQTPPFNETDPQQIKLVGGNVYDGKHYFNSGILSNAPNSGFQASTTYSLTFGAMGDFIYYCLVHPSMLGIVHVRPAGTPYPFSQQAYDQQIQASTQATISDGQNLAGMAKTMSNNHQVVASLGDGLVGLMRFYPASVTIHVGEKVTFTNHDVMEPHTITFGPEKKDIFHPYGNPKSFDGTAQLNSGYIGVIPAWSGTSFTVTFTKAGTFRYFCALHDYLAMIGEVVVTK